MAPDPDYQDLVDAHGVAELLGLSNRNSISIYQRRYPDMPRPVINLGPPVPTCGHARRSSRT